ncbi:MAG: carbamoyltransferase HypF [Cytophagales bacterium]|nr:MAG: carbamoyltransferase HypF [Cytophagales bacterium]
MTYHLHILGQVQGVGFRPFVFRLAQEMKLKGWVSNDANGVHIEINAEDTQLSHFKDQLLLQSPPLAKITQVEIAQMEERYFDNFEIKHSQTNYTPQLLITPDAALCEACKSELFDPHNRRYLYPFITCTNCGVRYSIIEKLPYDRIHTTMRHFEPCKHCQQEYQNPQDRRYYSQTNSCPQCAIDIHSYQVIHQEQNENNTLIPLYTHTPTILNEIIQYWKDGKIVAIKGIGGYLLTCDATQAKAIRTLRQRKKRPHKPFALMYPDVESITKDIVLSEKAKNCLESSESPIVLLPILAEAKHTIALQEIAPQLDKVGIMMPYNPLFAILLQKFKKPIVATSGNLSQQPIVFTNEKAFSELALIADYIITHNRPILIPQDDSIVQLDEQNHTHLLRRARGFAPNYIDSTNILQKDTMLATGAMMKSTIALSHQKNIFLSQYIGDIDSLEAQENYCHIIQHYLQLFNTQPQKIITDQHPEYFSTQWGKTLSEKYQIPLLQVQHHTAHFAAILAEKTLLDSNEKILGIIWDGTGWGTDGQIWGGEFFVYQQKQIERVHHLPYFPFILGDKMPKEPRLSALCLAHQYQTSYENIQPLFTTTEWNIYQKILTQNTLKTSSMGRVFDAVAASLSLLDKASYEGQAAAYLEQMAWKAWRKNTIIEPAPDPLHCWQEIQKDIENKKNKEYIALKLHIRCVEYIDHIAEKQQVQQLAFSGGVFQNMLLITLLKQRLEKKYQLHFHEKIPTNDENIAFGQLIVGHYSINLKNNLQLCV